MFKDVCVEPPYPATGLTAAGWRAVRARYVPISELVATKEHLVAAALDPAFRAPHDLDRLVHVVKYGGLFYLEDGHHRTAREALAGSTHVQARVVDLDRCPVTPAAEVSREAAGPGLVWVEGRGYRSVHLARALQAAGAQVDWHNWSPGTSDRARLPYAG